MDEKIKTRTLRFPAKENPNMEKALFDWPILLQCDVKAKYRLISRKVSGMKCFLRAFVFSVLFARFHFKVRRKSLYVNRSPIRPVWFWCRRKAIR